MVSRKQLRLGRDAAQMAAAVPQVVAHRVGRMVGAGFMPNGSDQQEFYRMGAEKAAAFHESWAAMTWQAMATQQQFIMWWSQTWWKVALGGWTNPPSWQHLSTRAQRRWVDGMVDVAREGMAPVHRRAVANAKRLNAAALGR